MLLSSLKKIGCKRLIRVTNLCRGVISQLNGGGYRLTALEMIGNTTFIRLKYLLDQPKLSKKNLNSS